MRRRIVIATGAAAALAAVVLGLAHLGGPERLTGAPVVFAGTAGERAAEGAAMASWLQGDPPDVGLVYRAWTTARQLAPIRAADRHEFLQRRLTGPAVVPVGGADLSATGAQTVAVVLSCSTTAAVRWTLDAGPTGGGAATAVAEARTPACGRTPTIAVAHVAAGRALDALRVEVRRGVRTAFVVLTATGTPRDAAG